MLAATAAQDAYASELPCKTYAEMEAGEVHCLVASLEAYAAETVVAGRLALVEERQVVTVTILSQFFEINVYTYA